MQLNPQQMTNLIIGLEHIGKSYTIDRASDGTCTVSVNGNSFCMTGLKRYFEKHDALAWFNIESTNMTRTINARIHDISVPVICEFNIEKEQGIDIVRMTIAEGGYPLDWSRKIYQSVIAELERVVYEVEV